MQMLSCSPMPVPVIISKASISMEEGSILKWFKTEGEAVGEDELLFEMETDKTVVEVAAPAAGVVLKILAAEGPVKVGTVVGWIGEPGDSIDAPADLCLPAVESIETLAAQSKPESRPNRILATPAARRRASELGLALVNVQSSSPGGRIEQEDVERAAARRAAVTQQSAPHFGDRKPLIQRLTTTWQSVPHIHVARLLDADGLMEAKKIFSDARSSITDLLLQLLVSLLPRFPELCMVWEEDELVRASQLNLAFAVDTDRGVVAPVIMAANTLNLKERSEKRRELTEAARTHRLRPNDIQGGTFTLTNLGMEGVDFFAPIINAPQTAILATGRLRQEPIVSNGGVSVGWRMWVNLAVDHRVTDGRAAARFLEHLQIELGQLSKTLHANS
jgi:pyruvate dehydrogenase E2 component (dihydrolipoamide acetyltransferase)